MTQRISNPARRTLELALEAMLCELRPKAIASGCILELKAGDSQLAGRFTRVETNGLAKFYAVFMGDELLLAFDELREFSRGLI